MTKDSHHRIVIVGGGSAGIAVAARLRRLGQADVAIIEPSDKHYYQPLWTLVGGGCAPAAASERDESKLIPLGVRWIKDRAVEIDPDSRAVTIGSGLAIGYDFLVVCPGIQLDWDKIPGLGDALGKEGVSSNYDFDLAPKTWEFLKDLRGGTALFTMPTGPIKCPGAPQKTAYLAAHWWQLQGVLKDIHVVLAVPMPKLFGVPEFRVVLEQVVERYGIDVRFEHQLVEVKRESKEVVFKTANEGETVSIPYDVMHTAPPQSAPDWIKKGPLSADDATGYVEVDKHTHQHLRWPNVFSLGDACSTPNSKTGAAIRKQAPVVAKNLLAVMDGKDPSERYDGYAACPFTTARNKMLLAEFDYSMKPHPTIPLIDTQKERRDMWYLKRWGLPFFYWNLMLRGLG
ncbi:MAG: FAD-dependent oxidoreductase [Candidatus Binatia bacterium]